MMEEAIRRVVEAADPDQIWVFGSTARGEAKPASDLDLLVIKDGDYDYHRLIAAIYRALARVDREVEVVLVTPAQAERYRNSHCLVIHPALKEGKVVYERTAV